MNWTPEMQDTLRNLWMGSTPFPVIAATLGSTRTAIYAKGRRLGLPERRGPDLKTTELRKMREMAMAGKTREETAIALCRPYNSINTWARKHKVQFIEATPKSRRNLNCDKYLLVS